MGKLHAAVFKLHVPYIVYLPKLEQKYERAPACSAGRRSPLDLVKRHLRSHSLALWLLAPLLGFRLGLRLGLGRRLSFLQLWLVVITFFISRGIFALPLVLLHLLGQKLEGVLFRQNLHTPADNNGGRPPKGKAAHCTRRKPTT